MLRRLALCLVLAKGVMGCATGEPEVKVSPAVDSTVLVEDSATPDVDADATKADATEAGATDATDAAADATLDSDATIDASDASETSDGKAVDSAPIFEADTCETGLSICASLCVDLMTDRDNCGKCGTVCPSSSSGCSAGMCLPPGTTFKFPDTTSTTFRFSDSKTSTLGAGGGRVFRSAGDYIQGTVTRSTPITKLTINFKMSDGTSDLCTVGTLNWNIYINGTIVGSYSWAGGKTPYVGSSTPMGPDQTISKTIAFAPIMPASGGFALKYVAMNSVCAGGGEWNWYPGGTATVD